jgi:hypothetical protein
MSGKELVLSTKENSSFTSIRIPAPFIWSPSDGSVAMVKWIYFPSLLSLLKDIALPLKIEFCFDKNSKSTFPLFISLNFSYFPSDSLRMSNNQKDVIPTSLTITSSSYNILKVSGPYGVSSETILDQNMKPLNFFYNKDPTPLFSQTIENEEMSYGFCGCAEPERFVKTLINIYKLGNVHLIEEKLRENVPLAGSGTGPTFFKGFVGLFIEYFNYYNVELAIEKIQNPYPEEFKTLLLFCLKFLLMNQDEEFNERSSLDHTSNPDYRYIALNSFIYEYLKIPDNDDGYSYVVMQYLENTFANEVFPTLWNDSFINHGSGIRCAWLNVYPGEKGNEYVDKIREMTSHIDGEDIKRVMFE